MMGGVDIFWVESVVVYKYYIYMHICWYVWG